MAECSAVVAGAEMSIKRGWLKVWMKVDSTSVAHTFGRRQVLWELQTRWQNVSQTFERYDCLFISPLYVF
ncbi:hypothetical protein AQUCO_00800231v1 [Aquilegia coerulea]|uniref:RNase H type-1 domain-containing protein n=1 Tax=Aquilegia coerulea TaxID=218851 RepID=A0A2G5EI01_AQUCA|nr:hypothetical protein AQUCO_00800231v1 [Aquilegia coerulea]